MKTPFDSTVEIECRLRLRIELDKGAPTPIRNLEVAGLLSDRHLAFVVDPILAIEFSDIARFRVDHDRAMVQGVAEGRILHLEFSPSPEQEPDLWDQFCVLVSLRVSGLACAGKPFLQAVSRESLKQTAEVSLQALDELLASTPSNRIAKLWKARIFLGQGKNLAALEQLRPTELRVSPEGRLVAALAALQAGKMTLAAALIWPDRSPGERLLQAWMSAPGLRSPDRADQFCLSIFLPMLQRPGGVLSELPWPESERRLYPPQDALFEGWLAWISECVRTDGSVSCPAGEAALERYRRSSGADPIEVIRLESALALLSGNAEQAWRLAVMAAVPEFFQLRALLGLRLEKEQETLASPSSGFPAHPDGEDLWLLAALHLAAGNQDEAANRLKQAVDADSPDSLIVPLIRGENALIGGDVASAEMFLDGARAKVGSGKHWLEESVQRLRISLLAAGIRIRQGKAQEALIELARATALVEVNGSRRGLEALQQLRQVAQKELERSEAEQSGGGHSHLLAAIERLVTRIDRVPPLADLRSRARGLLEDSRQPLLLAVMGECKAGKSTLMNALLGEDLFPTGSVPTTAIPWMLKPGSQEVALVYGPHGAMAVTAPDRLAAELPHLGFDPTRVELFQPAMKLKGVALVDTPGLNSLYVAHQDASEDFLEHADAILWVFDATQIGRRSEREVLHHLLPKQCPVILVLNRIDEVEPDEVDEVVAQAVELAGHGPGRGQAVSVSGRQARDAQIAGDEDAFVRSGFPSLRKRLHEELESRSWQVKTGRLHERARELLRIVTERRMADRTSLDSLIQRGHSLREKVSGMLGDWRSAFVPVIKEWIRRSDLKETAEAAFRRETHEWLGTRPIFSGQPTSSPELGEVRRRVRAWLMAWIDEYLDYWVMVATVANDKDVGFAIGGQCGALRETGSEFAGLLEQAPDSETLRRLSFRVNQISDRLANGTGRALEHLAALRVSRDLLWFGPILEIAPTFSDDCSSPSAPGKGA